MRLFVAVHFSPEVRRALLTAMNEIRRTARDANVTRPENLHLTLAFIGETNDIRGAREALDGIVCPAFELTVGGSGRFGDLLWAGISENQALATLAEDIQNALRDRGFDIERRPFKPHITLARQVRSEGPLRLIIPDTKMIVSRVSLMKSERVNGRLTYTEVYGKVLGRTEELSL
ncbi:MAG: RNA 2',3'-cyclic phosphodiesterase [Clostridia bacterium]|nr:RNA 2',3'-cyclic phosphodiesterase [Clostridia bacterium]